MLLSSVEVILILSPWWHGCIFWLSVTCLLLLLRYFVLCVAYIKLICVDLIFILESCLFLNHWLLLLDVWILIEWALSTSLLVTASILVLRLVLLGDLELLILYLHSTVLWLLLLIDELLWCASTFQVASFLILYLLSLSWCLIEHLVDDCISWKFGLWAILGLKFLLHKFAFLLSNVWLIAGTTTILLVRKLLSLYAYHYDGWTFYWIGIRWFEHFSNVFKFWVLHLHHGLWSLGWNQVPTNATLHTYEAVLGFVLICLKLSHICITILHW